MPSFQTILSGSFLLISTLAGLGGLAGCGSTVCDAVDCQGGGGGEGGGSNAACMLEPPGKSFTFHVHNGGTKALRLTYGCGATLPIEVETPKGALDISPGGVNSCEVTCDRVHEGFPNRGCTDCGPGVGAPLEPGMTKDITWDRRVYTAHMADPKCSGSTTGNDCALGALVAPASAQKGVLTVCSSAPSGGDGYCSEKDQSTVSFTLDTAKDEGTIEVQ